MIGFTMSEIRWKKIEKILDEKSTDETIHLRGWVYRTRSSGNIVFTVIRDSTGTIQATVKKDNLPDN